MPETKFVYVTYIASTPEKIWDAIVTGDIARQYWGAENVSDWQPGSPWRHVRGDASRTVMLEGKVLESDRPRRLAMTWAEPNGGSKPSRVTITLDPLQDMVRVTVVHDELEEGSDMAGRIANGWPRVLSSLKSFLETGRPLNVWAS
jgi:uncharacterized protein YndB with AHSA1/START domain